MPKGRSFARRSGGRMRPLTRRPMSQSDVYRMIGRRAADAGIEKKIGCHTFRATRPRTSKTAAVWKLRSRSPHMNRHAQRGFTIAVGMT
jgi:hypothetical protein